jgi:hypothetical protein
MFILADRQFGNRSGAASKAGQNEYSYRSFPIRHAWQPHPLAVHPSPLTVRPWGASTYHNCHNGWRLAIALQIFTEVSTGANWLTPIHLIRNDLSL